MASSNRVGEPVWIAPSAAARIGGETLPPLILNALGTRTTIDARLDGSIQDGSIESTTKGAPSLTLSVLDPDGEMLNSDLFARRIDLDMDNVPFRLVQVSRQEEDLLSLEFEHRLCSWLREHDTPRKASRGTKTRAEFAYSLVLEVKKEPIHFVSPDLDKRQPRAAAAVKTSTRKGRDGRKAPGFSDNATSLKIGGATATRSQLREADKALGVAAGLKASPLATKAMMVAGIGESKFKAIMNLGGSPYGGVFQGKARERGGPWDIADTEGMAESFLKGGKGFQGGGAIALAKQRPPLSAGGIAFRVEGDISNFGGNAARAAAFYDKWSSEAERLIDAWRGASSGGLSDAQKTGFAKFEFTRGAIHKGDAKEDSWMALQRLADEVRWRCFIDGRNVFYFVSDDQLMRSRPLYLVDRETQGVRSVTFDMEVGRRTVIYKGRRQRKPSEAILKVRMGRWAAPPGSVIELADYGLADGRWLVDSMSRGIFDAEAEVHLRQPQKALPEPAHGHTAGGGGTSGGGGGGGGGKGSTGKGAKGEQIKNTFRGSPVPGQRPGPSTHETGGLPGYPARDYFGPPGTPCVAPENGKIRKLSGRDPKLGGVRGGPMGYSIYVAADSGNDYFLTHLDNVLVRVGQRVTHGEQIAEIARSGAGSWDNGSTHVHCGVHRGRIGSAIPGLGGS